MQEIKRVGVLSAGKVVGVLYLVLSLLIAIPLACLSLFSGSLLATTGIQDPEALGFGFATGIGGALVYGICVPIFYAVFGFIGGALSALVYNFVAGFMGGIELELGPPSSKY